MKQETLEEAAESYAEKWNDLENQFKLSSCFMAGAKWQQERMYSEEELEVAYFEGKEGLYSFNDWFEQLKKK